VENLCKEREINLQQYSFLQNNETGSSSKEEDFQRQSNFQLKQKKEVFIEVFSHVFYDPVAAHLESFISSRYALLFSYEYGFWFYDDSPLYRIFFFPINGIEEI
jgi:hypothetical protein